MRRGPASPCPEAEESRHAQLAAAIAVVAVLVSPSVALATHALPESNAEDC